MSAPLGAISREDRADERYVTVHVSKRVMVGLLLFVQIVTLGLITASWIGIEVPLLRPAFGVVFLSVLPGFLLLRVIGIRPTDVTDGLLYAVGLSLFGVMAYGLAVNLVALTVGYRSPITEEVIVPAISGFVFLLTGLYYISHDTSESLTFSMRDVTSPIFPLLLLLPFLGIYGAYALNLYSENIVVLLLFGIIVGVIALVYAGKVSKSLLPLAVWMIALALLFQNTLTGSFLAWGDSPTEVEHVLRVLSDGYWSPEVSDITVSNQYTMLRLTILHPVYVLFTGLEIVWVYKLVHPLLFSLTPVALYQGYKRFVTAKAAFLSTFFFMSMFSFYIVLSRNTRTATALFFLALLVLLLLDDHLSGAHRKLLAILFASCIVVSHYGVSYILLFAFVLLIPAFLVAEYLRGRPNSLIDSTRPSWTCATYGFVAFYIALAFTWYIYASPESSSYRLVLNFGQNFTTTLLEQFTGYEESATVRVLTEEWGSSVIHALRYYHVVLGVFIAVGIFGTGLRSVGILDRPENPVILEELHREFVVFAAVFLAIFGVTFLPIQRINTARTFAIALIFLAPFLLLGIVELSRLIGSVSERTPSATPVFSIAVGLLLLYFLLNSGIISALAVNEYSPNALVEKDRITSEGHPIEQNYFYKQHPTVYQIGGTVWMRTQAAPNATVHHGFWPGGMRSPIGYEHYRQLQDEYVPVQGAGLAPNGTYDDGYVFLGSFEHKGNVVAYSPGQFGFVWEYRSDIEDQWEEKDRIYHNGECVVRY